MLFSKDELYECCAEIGIPEQNILLIKHSTLRDDPNLRHGVQNDSEIFKNTSKYAPSKKRIFLGGGNFFPHYFSKIWTPGLRWREELVSEIVLRHVAALSIDTVITFDRYGVSGHRNHIALYYAMGCLAMEVKIYFSLKDIKNKLAF